MSDLTHTYFTLRQQARRAAYDAASADLERRMVALLPDMTLSLAHYLRTTPERREEWREVMRDLAEAEARALYEARQGRGHSETSAPASLWALLTLGLMDVLGRLTCLALMLAALYFVSVWLIHHGLLPFWR